MDNNEILYNKYLKYKEKYLFLQQIAAGYQKQKDFTRKIANQDNKIATINNTLNTVKEQLKTAMTSEMSTIEAYNRDINNKNLLKELNNKKSISHNLKKKLELIQRTLTLAKSERHNLTIKQRDSRERIAENNVNYAKKKVIEKKNVIAKLLKKIEKLNIQVKIAEGSLVVAQTKESVAVAKLNEMTQSLLQVESEELSRLGGNTMQINQQVIQVAPEQVAPEQVAPEVQTPVAEQA